MTKEIVISVFVSSPSDMDEEREKLADVVDDLNRTSRQTVLRLIRWETHGIPGIGSDPQDVLNTDLSPEDADIFVGLMWVRYGTSTGRSGSGTEEEFNRAFEHHKDDPNANQIMFYFKTAPPPSLNDIDINELARVKEFKESLGDKGGLYWEFNTLSDFERDIRFHLSRRLQDVLEKHANVSTSESQAECTAVTRSDDELGLLDYLDIVAGSSVSLTEIAHGISEETKTVGERLIQRTREIAAVSAQSPNPMASSQLRRPINRAATDLTTYAASLRTKVPLFDERLSESINAAGQVAILFAFDLNADEQQMTETRRMLDNLDKEISGAIESMGSFRSSIRGVPRMTSRLNIAKRDTINVVQQLINSLASARGTIRETLKALAN